MKKSHILVSVLLFTLVASVQAADSQTTGRVEVGEPTLLPNGSTAIYGYNDSINEVYKASRWPDGSYTGDIQVLNDRAGIRAQVDLTGQEAQNFYNYLSNINQRQHRLRESRTPKAGG